MIQENIDFLPMGQEVSSSQFGCYKIKLTRCQDTLVLFGGQYRCKYCVTYKGCVRRTEFIVLYTLNGIRGNGYPSNERLDIPEYKLDEI